MDGVIENRQGFCRDVAVAAERELSAFVAGVGQLFGSEEVCRQQRTGWRVLFDYSVKILQVGVRSRLP
jgi:hypothetical protein